MITGIREKTVVKENGTVEIFAPDLPVGTQVEVIVLVEEKKQDTTEYLLSTEANRRHLEESLRELEHPENFIYVGIDDLDDLCKK
ncbi:MAG: hypothetical protein M3525_00890 [Acidobacteriota bacterium]|nr:hypothetical protein [Acidobacteriota bacterium]